MGLLPRGASYTDAFHCRRGCLPYGRKTVYGLYAAEGKVVGLVRKGNDVCVRESWWKMTLRETLVDLTYL